MSGVSYKCSRCGQTHHLPLQVCGCGGHGFDRVSAPERLASAGWDARSGMGSSDAPEPPRTSEDG